jgi:hypothetical protein
MNYVPEILRKVVEAGHCIFESGPYDLNLVVVRRHLHGLPDDLTVSYQSEKGSWITESFPCTTTPSTKFLVNPVNPAGSAILVAGQYQGAYTRGKHRGRKAIVQVGEVTVYRDDNRDTIANEDASSIQTGFFGINIHDDRGGSAGCILAPQCVINRLRELFRLQENEGLGNRVTLTLLCY